MTLVSSRLLVVYVSITFAPQTWTTAVDWPLSPVVGSVQVVVLATVAPVLVSGAGAGAATGAATGGSVTATQLPMLQYEGAAQLVGLHGSTQLPMSQYIGAAQSVSSKHDPPALMIAGMGGAVSL